LRNYTGILEGEWNSSKCLSIDYYYYYTVVKNIHVGLCNLELHLLAYYLCSRRR